MKELLIKTIKNPLTYAFVLLFWILIVLGKLERKIDSLESDVGFTASQAEEAAKSASSCYGISRKIDDIKDDVYYLKKRRCY